MQSKMRAVQRKGARDRERVSYAGKLNSLATRAFKLSFGKGTVLGTSWYDMRPPRFSGRSTINEQRQRARSKQNIYKVLTPHDGSRTIIPRANIDLSLQEELNTQPRRLTCGRQAEGDGLRGIL